MLVDAETGQRGYLITGNESYLEPFAAAQSRLPGALAKTRALVAALLRTITGPHPTKSA